jgi:polyisoprenoid-binding protein YceI
VGAEGYGHPHGVSGQLASGKIDLGGPGDLVFDMKSFVADRPDVRAHLGLTKKVSSSDQRKVTEAMLGADVLDVARFPKAAYSITAIAPLDGQPPGDTGRYQVDGEFTLHGVKRPLRVLSALERTDRAGVLLMRGSFTILQTQFGITPYSALGGFVRVTDKLEVWADLVLLNPPP